MSLTDEFRAFFEIAPGANLVTTREFIVYAVSDDYLQHTATRRDDVVGRSLFELVGEGELDAESVATMRASYRQLLEDGRPLRLPLPQHRQLFSKALLGADGRVAYIVHQLEREPEQDERARMRDSSRADHFVDLLDTAPDAIVIVGDDGLIQLINVQTEKLFDYARDQLIGRPLEVLIPERFRHEHARHLSRYFAAPSTRSMGSGLELYGRCKDGREIPIEVSLSPHRREGRVAVSAAIRDISERKRIEAAARLTSARLASAVESIQDAFALFDADDRLVLCNSEYSRLLQFDSAPSALIGKPFEQLFDALLRDAEFADGLARQRFREERITRRRSDPSSTFDLHLRDGRRLRVTDRQTAEGGIVKTIWDLTEEERRAEELREARAAAEAASAAKSEFLASMSHELRTPMNAILGFAQLLQMERPEPLSQRQRERVGYILSGGEHLLRLIDDVLDLARIEAGGVSVSIEPVSVLEVIHEVMKTLDAMAQRLGVSLSLAPARGELPMISADRTRFTQILMNLASNAIKYNRPGGKVRIVSSMPEGTRVRVTVVDTGLGIPLEKQSKLFQPFQRAGQETGSIEGTGIGLVISRQLAALMDGNVGFSSTPGEGSEFWVELPALMTEPHFKRVFSDAAPALLNLTGAQHLVLYVEDNPANVSFMRDLMSSFDNVELVTVPNAELGIALARERHPSAILMDINLPGMSGMDALQQLRSRHETEAIPVIALTAAASERDKQVGIQAGFFRYLTKPVKVDELVSALERVFTSDPSPV